MAEYVIDELGRVLKVRDLTYEDTAGPHRYVSYDDKYVYRISVDTDIQTNDVDRTVTTPEDQGAAQALWELAHG